MPIAEGEDLPPALVDELSIGWIPLYRGDGWGIPLVLLAEPFVIDGGIAGMKPLLVTLVGPAEDDLITGADDAFVGAGETDRWFSGELLPELVVR